MRNSKSGVALIMVMMSLALMSVLSIEIFYSSRVDLRIARSARDRVQAYWLAQGAMRFAQIRLFLFKEATNLLNVNKGQNLGAMGEGLKSQLDQIWRMDFPEYPFNPVDNPWPGRISTRIESEGSKIPVNLLDGSIHRNSSPEIAKSIYKQLIDLLEGFLRDEAFEEKYGQVPPKEYIDSLVSWISPNSPAGGNPTDEGFYERQEPPYKARLDRIPTLGDLHLIRGWDDAFVEKMKPHLTVFGNSVTINPNYISLERLKTFSDKLESEDLAQIEKRRREQPFRDLEDMQAYINSETKNGRDFKFPEEFGKGSTRETLFSVVAAGVVGDVKRAFRAYVKIPEEPTKGAGQKTAAKPGETPPPEGEGSGKKEDRLPNLKDPVILRFEEEL